MTPLGRGRVKRRSPTIIEQFTVAAWAKAWRIFRILYPKSNRIACFRKGGEFSHGLGRGRVKRRSPTIIEQFTVAAWAKAWRIFRILYPKSNRIACFRKGGEFSHGLGHEDQFVPPSLSGRCGDG